MENMGHALLGAVRGARCPHVGLGLPGLSPSCQPWSARVLSADSPFRAGRVTVVWPLGSAAETWGLPPRFGCLPF